MTDQGPESPDKLLDELHSLQALLDQDADDPGIPVLSDVIDEADGRPDGNLSPTVNASTLELDFDGFEVDEQLLREGLGLEEPIASPPSSAAKLPEAPFQATLTATTSPTGPVPETLPPDAVAPAAAAAAPDSATAPATPIQAALVDAANPAFDELLADLVDQCLLELEDLLRPRLEQLCRDLLAGAAPPERH